MKKNTNKTYFKQYKQLLLEIIQKVIPGCKVYLFGSRARGDHGSGADIDLALDVGRPIERKELFSISDQIEETTIPLFVDLVDLHCAPEKLKLEIENEGILWES